MATQSELEPTAEEDAGSPHLDVGEEVQVSELEEPGDEVSGPAMALPEEDLDELEGEGHDEDASGGAESEADLALHVVEEAAGADDDAPGPAVLHEGDDGSRDLGDLEAEAEGSDEAGETDTGELELALHEGEDTDEHGGAEGIAGEDPAAALEEAPAIDGAEGEGEGLGEPLPEIDEAAIPH